jgi:transposase
MLDGVFWILRTGSPWRDLPEEFGPWETVYCRFDQWNDAGIFDKILRRLQAAYLDVGALDSELWCVDGTIPSKETDDRSKRPVDFDREAFRKRNIIERLIGWLKESRRVFSRFEKTAKNFGGMLKLAFIRRFFRVMEC